MTYRVYSGPKGPEDVSPQSVFKESHTFDEALSWARHLDILAGRHWALRVGMREEIDGSASA
jgi:hypothetical protein